MIRNPNLVLKVLYNQDVDGEEGVLAAAQGHPAHQVSPAVEARPRSLHLPRVDEGRARRRRGHRHHRLQRRRTGTIQHSLFKTLP